MESLECRADQDADRSGKRGVPKRQSQAWTDESDGNRKKLKVADEPEQTLIHHASVAFVFGDEVNRVSFDAKRDRVLQI